MTTAVVAPRGASPRSRRWLFFAIGSLAMVWLLLTPHAAQAQTIYHVDDDADDGLVAHWQFDHVDPVSRDLHNLIPALLDGVASTNAAYSTDVPTLLRANPRSIVLDGVNDHLVTPDDADLNVNANFTVAAWVKRDTINAPTYDPIYDAGTGTNDWVFFITGDIGGTANDNRLGFGIRGVTGAEFYADTIIPADGQWRHVAMVLDTSTNPNLRFYLNGTLDGSAQVTHTIDVPSGGKLIGAIADGGLLRTTFDGRLDELRVYDQVLSQSEITRLASGATCPTTGAAWATAFPDLQCALEVSVFGDTIRVAKGRYLPGINPDAQFTFSPGDNIQGGFNGNEATNQARPPITLDQNDPAAYLNSSQYTNLTGDVLGNDPTDRLTDPGDTEETDNLLRVFTLSTAAVTSNLDGVVVTGGRGEGSAGGGGQLQGAPILSNSIFLYNRANFGGGLHVGFNATPTLNNLRFLHNAATTFGGGIEAEGFTTLANTRFISNTAGVSGGGMDVREDGAAFTNVDFERNQSPRGGGVYLSPNVTDFTYTTGILAENHADSGGAIHSEAVASLDTLLIRANHAISEGGGIYSDAPLSINNATILSNTQSASSPDPDVGGGGIHSSSSITLVNSTLQGNLATAGGGLRVENTIAAESVTISNVTVRGNGATDNNGGGVFLRVIDAPLTVTLTDVIFEANFTNDDEGGGLAANGGNAPFDFTALRLTVLNNTAAQHGGGISLENSVNSQITDSLFEGNVAEADGGGLFIAGGSDNSPILTNVTFRANHATNGSGGALYFCCTGGVLQVNHVRAELNSSQLDGGGFYLCCGATLQGEHLMLHDNATTTHGGGMSLCCTSELSALQHVTITANSAISNGGGIYLTGGGALVITDGQLNNNTAGPLGGAVYSDTGGDFTLLRGHLQENHAASNGGALFMQIATLVMTDVVVIRNTSANNGGAGLSLLNVSDSKLWNVNFVENNAGDDDGGAIRIRGGDLQMDRVSFLGNRADESGGALSVEDDAVVLASNVLMVGNSANTGGGPSVNDSNLIHMEDDSQLTLINATLAANSGAGSSLFQIEQTAKLTVTNAILWDNAPPSASIPDTGVLLQQNVITGSPTDGVDPRFIRNPTPGDGDWTTLGDNDYGDLQLRATSPALDQGNGALLPPGITLDFGGNARTFDNLHIANVFSIPVDLGAFEARFVAPTAQAGGPYTGNEAQPVALDGSASSDDGTINTFAWDCTDDATFDLSSSSATGQSCTYADQGTFTLRLLVTDSDGLTNTTTVAVTINNVAPSAQNDNVTTPQDTLITIDVLANDSDVPADPLTITQVGAPTNGSATIEANQVRYTPEVDFTGNTSFSYTISDGDGGSATATVNVTVTGDDDAPATIHLPILSKE